MTNVLELSQESVTKGHNATLYDTLFRVDAIRNNLKKLIWDSIYQQTAMYKILEPEYVDKKELQPFGSTYVKPIQLEPDSMGLALGSDYNTGKSLCGRISVPFIKFQSKQYKLGKELKDYAIPFEKVIDDSIVKPMSESLDQMFFDFCRVAVSHTKQIQKIKKGPSVQEIIRMGCMMIDRNMLTTASVVCHKSFLSPVPTNVRGRDGTAYGKQIVVSSVKKKVFGNDIFFFTTGSQLGRCYLLPERMNCHLDMNNGIMEFGFDFEQALALTNINGVSMVTLED